MLNNLLIYYQKNDSLRVKLSTYFRMAPNNNIIIIYCNVLFQIMKEYSDCGNLKGF